MAQRQRGRCENGGRRAAIALASEDVEDDVGGVDTLGDRLRAGCLDRRQPVAEHRGKDVDHLPIAVVDAGELAGRLLTTASANRALFRCASVPDLQDFIMLEIEGLLEI